MAQAAFHSALGVRLRSSVVEQGLHKAKVTGSNPVAATIHRNKSTPSSLLEFRI